MANLTLKEIVSMIFGKCKETRVAAFNAASELGIGKELSDELGKYCDTRAVILSDCINLTHLPEGFVAKISIAMDGCINLKRLPDGFYAEQSLSLSGCTSLETLPEGFWAAYGVSLWYCTGLTHLPEGIRCSNLDLRGCTALTKMPKTLYLRGYLNLEGSGVKDTLYTSEGFRVGGHFYPA